jgi:hypothetical protein
MWALAGSVPFPHRYLVVEQPATFVQVSLVMLPYVALACRPINPARLRLKPYSWNLPFACRHGEVESVKMTSWFGLVSKAGAE